MVALMRMRVHWNGFTGAPGINTLLFDDTSVPDPAPSVRTLYETIKTYMAQGVTIDYDNTGDLVDSATGALAGAWSGTAAASSTSTGTGSFAGPAGAVILWKTGTIVNRRRLLGKSFLVPLDGDAFGTDGRPSSSMVTAINTALATFLGTTPGQALRVWHRPKNGAGGSVAAVTSAVLSLTPSVLRSRRH